jgi:hypothetical protein
VTILWENGPDGPDGPGLLCKKGLFQGQCLLGGFFTLLETLRTTPDDPDEILVGMGFFGKTS